MSAGETGAEARARLLAEVERKVDRDYGPFADTPAGHAALVAACLEHRGRSPEDIVCSLMRDWLRDRRRS